MGARSTAVDSVDVNDLCAGDEAAVSARESRAKSARVPLGPDRDPSGARRLREKRDALPMASDATRSFVARSKRGSPFRCVGIATRNLPVWWNPFAEW